MFLRAVCERATWMTFSKHSGDHIKGFCEIYVYLDDLDGRFVVLERCLESVIFAPF